MRSVKNIRLKDYDYSANGCYFVTICSNYKQACLIDMKDTIESAINKLARIDGVKVDYHCIMSNHLHLIVILNRCSIPVGKVIRRLKARVSREAGFKVWQPNYYEHVIRNEKALNRIREYIKDNPTKEIIEFEQFYKL